MNDVQMMMLRWGDRAWWIIESVFLRSPNKEFLVYLGDVPPDMPRRPQTFCRCAGPSIQQTQCWTSVGPAS